MNKSIIEQKQNLVSEVAEELKNSPSSIVVEYRGLTVEKISELRRTLREEEATLKVYKNTIVSRAAESAGFSYCESVLQTDIYKKFRK